MAETFAARAVSEARAGAPAFAPARPLRLGLLGAIALQGLVAWLYVWFATGGSYHFASGANYYDWLADAFLAGQLHLKIAPAPELLALADPYDPEQHFRYRVPDLSLYDGKYYLYFGPVPGLLHALWKGLTGRAVPENAMQVIFGLGACFWFWLLARELRDRAFPRVSDGWVLLVYVCHALGGVALYLQARPFSHHEIILAASCFTLAGFYWWARGLAGGRYASWQLALAGLLFGCAIGTRMPTFGYGLGAGLVLVWYWLRGPRRGPAARRLLAFGLPPAAIVGLLLLYNYARFGAFTEFGLKYQLIGIKGVTLAFDARLIPHNLAAYLLFVPEFIAYYPFQWSRGLGAPGWYVDPPFASMLLLAPLSLLAPFAMGLLMPRWHSADPISRAFVVAGLVGILGVSSTLLTWIWAAGRFMQDLLPITGLLGGLVLWWLHPGGGAPRFQRLAHQALGGALLVSSLAMGVTYGLSYLSIGHPDTYVRLAYRSDRMTADLLRQVGLGAWPASYLVDEVTQRPWGIFYPEQSALKLRAWSPEPIRSLEVESLFPAATRVAVEVDGRIVGEERIAPGLRAVRLREPLVVGPPGQVTSVRLHFPDEPPRPAGFLWPLRVGSLSSRAEADPPRWR